MSDSTFTLRVEKQLKEDFIEAAKAVDRPGAQLIRDFMRDYVKQHQEAVERDARPNQMVVEGQDLSQGGNIVRDLLKEFASKERRHSTKHTTGSES